MLDWSGLFSMQLTPLTFIIVCPLVFLAGFMDAVVGGGGIISLPAYLMAGLPAHFAAGTNKTVNCLGTMVACGKYLKAGKVNVSCAVLAAGGSFVGSFIGTRIAIWIPEQTLQILFTFVLPVVAVFLATKKDFGLHPKPVDFSIRKTNLIALTIGFGIGLYDGLIGPGTGTFLIMAFTGFLGMNLLESSATAKVANLASNLASAILYTLHGNVIWLLFLPAVACNIIGNMIGVKFAILKGNKFIRYGMFVVLALLLIKTGYELLF